METFHILIFSYAQCNMRLDRVQTSTMEWEKQE
jgi:hypothetical protein